MGINLKFKPKTFNMIRVLFLLSLFLAFASSCLIFLITLPLPTTTRAPGRRKRSADECVQLEALEQMAFQYCSHGNDGFSWEEVKSCEDSVNSLSIGSSLPFAMPSKDDFESIDKAGDNDGILTMEEWQRFVGCN